MFSKRIIIFVLLRKSNLKAIFRSKEIFHMIDFVFLSEILYINHLIHTKISIKWKYYTFYKHLIERIVYVL